MRPQSTTFGDPRLPLRFWNKVEVTADGCWLWRAAHDRNGYGEFSFRDKRDVIAYRIAYKSLIGPVPPGLELDHLCCVPACVNPSHLEAVTHRINILRGNSPTAKHSRATHCVKGHPYDLLNTHYRRNGSRLCRICMEEALDAYMRRTRPKVAR